MDRRRPRLEPDQLASVLLAARRRGGRWAEVYVEDRVTETVRLDSGAVSEIRSDRDVGAGLRVVGAGGRSGFAYTNVLTIDALIDAAWAATMASDSEASGGEVARMDLRERVVCRPVQWADRPADRTDPAVKVDALRAVDAGARGVDKAVRNVLGIHVDTAQHVVVATSDGELRRDHRVRTRVTCRVTARRDEQLQTGFAGPGAGRGMELYADHPPDGIGALAAGRALRALAGVQPPTGPMPVVLGSAGGGLLLHEALGHGLEGDGLARGTSVNAPAFDERIASPLLTALDDPTLAQEYGSYAIDDAGTPATATKLLETGVQVGALTDADTAAQLGRPVTANARRESYAHPPITRMSNTYVQPGKDDPTTIIADVNRGVYAVTLRGGDVDIATGEFAFTASEAFLIEHGEVTRPLTGLTLLGNARNALGSVVAVGDDLALTQALCGKDGQHVPVSYGSPTLLVTGLSVAGGARG